MELIKHIAVLGIILWCHVITVNAIAGNTFANQFEHESWKLHSLNSISSLPDNVDIQFANLKLDHFNTNDSRIFELRYLVNDAVFKPGGPIFLLVGGQEPLFPVMLTQGPLFEIAEEHHGFLIYPELRYAGLSRPFRSLTLENLRYNNIGQSIEDLSALLQFIRKKHPELKDSKVILVGAGLGGSLAAFHRGKYPSASVGAWVSSAALEAVAEEPRKREEAGRNIRSAGSEACYQKIQKGFEEVEQLISRGETAKIEKVWKLCWGLNTTNVGDVGLFMHTLYTFYINLAIAPKEYILDRCIVGVNTRDNVHALALIVNDYLSQALCVDTRYDVAVRTLGNPNVQMDARAFYYTVCNEVGQWAPAGSPNQPFGTQPTLDFYIQFCNDVFNFQMTRTIYEWQTKMVNAQFGGKWQRTSNVYYTHGTRDPSRVLGQMVVQEPSSPVDILNDAGFAEDLYYFAYLPSEVSKSAQQRAKDLIARWLN